jgi:hypothetical protein
MKRLCALFLVPAACFSLETRPWLGNVWEFTFDAAFAYSRYHKVQNASVQLSAPSNDRVLAFDGGLTISPSIDAQVEIEFADTPRQSWGLRSTAIQGRYLWLDDISGDPVSFNTGINIRGVSRHSLKDVSCPYASDVNIELTASVGKEWSKEGDWTWRTWGFAALGIANHGLPWTRELIVGEGNWQNTHRFALFTLGDFGFGKEQHANVRHFDGWGKFHHQSIDLGAVYGYHCGVWGTLSLSYFYRVFARNFPDDFFQVTLNYEVPFSFF